MTPQMELWIRVYAATVAHEYTGLSTDPLHCRKVADAAVQEFDRSWTYAGSRAGWAHIPTE